MELVELVLELLKLELLLEGKRTERAVLTGS
jgi:hypothetical protein